MAFTKAGRYQLLEELGRGAMGVVYKAFDPVIGRSVAVKALRLNATGSGMTTAELVSRFQTETRAAGSLTHANVVSVFDAGEEDGVFYITMEYVEGSSLQNRLDKGQVFPLPRILRVMEQACAGLGFAHKRNIIHRDIKPANILLAPDDTLKITDFGTAKILQLGTTQSGHVIGTPSYMSPEQVKGKLVDGRSDIFSLGVILYELITGEKPFPGQNVTTVIYKIVNTEPIPPKELDASVPAGLNFIVAKALAKDPGMRFATCEEFAEALRRYPELGPSAEETVRMARPAIAGASVGGGLAAAVAPALAAVPAASAVGMAPMAGGEAGVTAASAEAVVVGTAAPATKTARGTKPGTRRRTVAKAEAATPTAVAMPGVPADEAAGGKGGWRLDAAVKTKRPVWRIVGGLAIFLTVAAADFAYLYWPNIRHFAANAMEEMRGGRDVVCAPPAVKTVAPPAAADTPAPSGDVGTGAATPPAGAGAVLPEKARGGNAATRELARLRDDLERQVKSWGLAGKVQVFVSGTELAVAGILSKAEHSRLVEKLRSVTPAPPWADHTQIADALAGTGKGGIEVLTTVAGAHAVVKNYDGKQVWACETPCSAKDLAPGSYVVETGLGGYRPEIRRLDVKGGSFTRTDITLEALFTTIIVTSEPPGAAVIIDGETQKEVTPATIYRAPGKCKVTVRKPGYVALDLSVEGQVNAIYNARFPMTAATGGVPQTPAVAIARPPTTNPGISNPGTSAPVPAKPTGALNVRTVPPGAEILIPALGSPYVTPRRVDLAPGEYTVTIFLHGYKPVKRTVTIAAGKETTLNESLVRSGP